MTIVYFIIALSILILVHEWGHFIVARLSGIRVEQFSLGFGPKIFGLKRGDTEYKLCAVPFGGYVKMSGDEPDKLDKSDQGSFLNKPVKYRAAVVMAGPIMNLILCLVLMPIVFMIGKSEPTFLREVPVVEYVRAESPADLAGIREGDKIIKAGEKEVDDWKELINEVLISANQDLEITIERGGKIINTNPHVVNLPDGQGGYLGIEPILYIGNEAVLDVVGDDTPASKAGIKPGDLVIAVDGTPVDDWTDMVMAVGKGEGKPLAMTLDRNGTKVKVLLTPEYNEELDRYLIGVSKDISNRDIPMTEVRYGFFGSIKQGFIEVGNLAGMTFKVLGRLVTLKLSYKALGGPIKIAQATAAAAQSGLASFLYFLSFLSLQLGILNLLPIPVLDGGHLVFFGIEAIRRKPLSEKIQGIAQQVGMALIILLLVVVSINDIMHIDAIKDLLDKIF